MKRLSRYLLAMLLPLCVLLTRPLTPALVLSLGQEVRLSTEPFDPRDLFRGDYVELRFGIEELSLDLATPEIRDLVGQSTPQGTTVYALLEPNEQGLYEVTALKSAPSEEGLYVKATLVSVYGERLRVRYGDGLSRFYVRENTGLDLERAAREGRVIASAKVWKGRIVLSSLETTEK